MKLAQWARENGIAYSTAYDWFHEGYLRGKKWPSGTIILDDENPEMSAEEIAEIKKAKRGSK